MTYTVHTKEFPHGITAKVGYDECPINPRAGWPTAFTMAIYESAAHRYGLGGAEQDHTYETARDFMLRLLADLYGFDRAGQASMREHEVRCGFDFDEGRALSPEGWEHGQAHCADDPEAHAAWVDSLRADRRYEEACCCCGDYYATDTAIMAEVERHYIIQPVYLYDHGGISISTGAFSCKWDSGQVGWMYISRKDAAKEWPVVESDATICAYMDSELDGYDAYLRGECYSYVVTDAEGEYLDSVGGYVGDLDGVIDEAENTALYYVNAYEKAQLEGLAVLEMNP